MARDRRTCTVMSKRDQKTAHVALGSPQRESNFCRGRLPPRFRPKTPTYLPEAYNICSILLSTGELRTTTREIYLEELTFRPGLTL